ncbi:hypothetical protein LZ198_08430 [Myxococcus sp. K15C18031901]|uniref:hypothetical protein n=1 Tax=Myxococcus dinghuensis TaxID=2906761 RepID=UPI0020A75195|nr:hypothetical protein [Myxococcus dinghuensis]MCP3098900.1 hypothetical protein [Myxococcus dinghuensis]
MSQCRPRPVDSAKCFATFTFSERKALGQLRQEVLDFILDFGNRVRASGMTHVTVLERDLPRGHQGSSLARQARGWILLVSDDERLITCYRRADANQFIRRKSKRRAFGKSARRPARHQRESYSRVRVAW